LFFADQLPFHLANQGYRTAEAQEPESKKICDHLSHMPCHRLF